MKCAYGFRGNSIANLYADNYDNVRFLKFYVLSWPIWSFVSAHECISI